MGDWIKKLDNTKYTIKWVINVDAIDTLEFSLEETKENLKEILNGIDISFVSSSKKSGFFSACQKVSKYIKLYSNIKKFKADETFVFWLEDDWMLINQVAPDLENILDKYVLKNSVTNFSFIRNNYIHALAPCIISFNLFKDLHLNAWNNNVDGDPESKVGSYFLKCNNLDNYDDINNLTVITKHKKHTESFFDSGIFNYKNSFYTYFEDNSKNIFKNNYLNNNDVKNKFNDDVVFIRFTCGFSRDLGRKYMEEQNLKKIEIIKIIFIQM